MDSNKIGSTVSSQVASNPASSKIALTTHFPGDKADIGETVIN